MPPEKNAQSEAWLLIKESIVPSRTTDCRNGRAHVMQANSLFELTFLPRKGSIRQNL